MGAAYVFITNLRNGLNFRVFLLTVHKLHVRLKNGMLFLLKKSIEDMGKTGEGK